METASAPATIRTVPQPVPTAAAKPRGVRLSILVFAITIVALIAAALVVSIRFAEDDGYFLWLMVMMGAAIIVILLAGVFIPFLKEARHHR